MSNNQNDIRSERRHLKINIGLIVFVVIFIYMVANGIMYFTRTHISFSEVQSGRIVDSDNFNGFIIRNETLTGADKDGYVNYFINDGDRVAKLGNVCVIGGNQSTPVDNASQNEEYVFNSSDYSNIKEQISIFRKNYTDSDYSDLYNLHYRLNNIISRVVSRSNIDSMDGNSADKYDIMTADHAGIISYTYDNRENITREEITPDLFNISNYEKVQLSAGTWVSRNSPVYKMIYDDNWEIILQPTPEQLKKLKDVSTVDIVFTRDDVSMIADVELFENDGITYVSLKLSNYMIRYCNDRYIDVEIIWNSNEGLKIPASSIITKVFYKIPIRFFVTNEETSEGGFYVSQDSVLELIKPDIYKRDDNYCYVNPKDIEAGTVLKAPDSDEVYNIGATEELDGVYYINKGYAMFRLIEILSEEGDYCIINDSTDYGVKLYDHIVLNGSSVDENQIIN